MTDHSKPHDGGPAFPISDMGVHGCLGMTLRDWFAGQAFTQAVEDYGQPSLGSNSGQRMNKGNTVLPYSNAHINREQIIAFQSYRYADAMLAARDRKAEP